MARSSHAARGRGTGRQQVCLQAGREWPDTVEANIKLGFAPDLRDYGVGAQILADRAKRIRLMTNNPKKLIGSGYGLEIVERADRLEPGAFNKRYLTTKK